MVFFRQRLGNEFLSRCDVFRVVIELGMEVGLTGEPSLIHLQSPRGDCVQAILLMLFAVEDLSIVGLVIAQPRRDIDDIVVVVWKRRREYLGYGRDMVVVCLELFISSPAPVTRRQDHPGLATGSLEFADPLCLR